MNPMMLRGFERATIMSTISQQFGGLNGAYQFVTEVGRVQSHGSPFSIEDSLGRSGRTCQGTL